MSMMAELLRAKPKERGSPAMPGRDSEAPSMSGILSRGKEAIMGGSSPDHSWDKASGRWRDVDGKYLPGPPKAGGAT